MHIVGGSVDAAIDLETLQVIQGCLPVWLQQEVVDWLKANREDLVKEWQTWQQ